MDEVAKRRMKIALKTKIEQHYEYFVTMKFSEVLIIPERFKLLAGMRENNAGDYPVLEKTLGSRHTLNYNS